VATFTFVFEKCNIGYHGNLCGDCTWDRDGTYSKNKGYCQICDTENLLLVLPYIMIL
jgi:hypothetical protein